MELKALKCPQCGASISEDVSGRKEIFCSFCGGKIYVDDGVQRSEHVEEKRININKKIENHYVDEAELQKAKNEKNSLFTMVALIALMLIIGVAACIAGYKYREAKLVEIPDNSIEVSFQNAILGKASEKMDLIVMEQEISVKSTLEKKGLFNWGIFKKNKDITYVGKAIYTVNLKQMRENDIQVDDDKKIVKVYVPKPEVYDLIIDPDDFLLGETSKGLLAFGDIKMTIEEAFYIEKNAVDSLKELAINEKQIEKATKNAEKQVKDLFGQSVVSVDSDYKLDIVMY